MKNVLSILVASLGLIYFSYMGFFVWFKPNSYLKDIHNRKKKIKSKLGFLPNWLIDYAFFFEAPKISIGWARIVTLLAVLICIFGLTAAIFGPF
jgi:hypothetical protein